MQGRPQIDRAQPRIVVWSSSGATSRVRKRPSDWPVGKPARVVNNSREANMSELNSTLEPARSPERHVAGTVSTSLSVNDRIVSVTHDCRMNAVFNATGKRFRDLPIMPQDLLSP